MSAPGPDSVPIYGIINVGNTCYMNAILQILFQCSPLTNIDRTMSIADLRSQSIKNPVILIFAWWRKLIHVHATHVIHPQPFVNALRYFMHPGFKMHHQNDAVEFLTAFIHLLCDALRTPSAQPAAIDASKCDQLLNGHTEIEQLFYGTHISTLTLDDAPRHIPELFFVLHVDIPVRNGNVITLDECLQHYVSGHVVQNATTHQTRLWTVPPLLVVHLKRFIMTTACRKLQTMVEYPVDGLDLAPYMFPRTTITTPPPILYDLWGVCIHSGSIYGGHYIAYVKHATTGTWYACNDVSVSVVSTVVVQGAYCLFYRRRGYG